MYFLATSPTAWTRNAIFNRITIEAGFENEHAIIFDGNISDATPNLDTADYSIQIKATQGYQQMLGDPIPLSFPGAVSASIIAARIAQEGGQVFFDGIGATAPLVTDYSFSGNLAAHMRKLATDTGLNIYTVGERLYIAPHGESPEYRTIEVGVENGMVGTPILDTTGGTVKMRMNLGLASGQKIKIKSRKYPELYNGLGIIETIGHEGDTMGGPWWSTVKFTREGVGGFYQ